MKIAFEVPGDPVGYYAAGLKPNYTRQNIYHAYKEKVQIFAKQADLKLPLVVSMERPILIATMAIFRNGRHPDPANVQKGICDALFYTKHEKGAGDKWTSALSLYPMYDAVAPLVVVLVSDEEDDRKRLCKFFSGVMR